MNNKFKNILNEIKQEIKNNYLFYLIIIIILLSNIISFDYEVYSPGKLENLNDRIIVDNKEEIDGSYNLTYVTARKGTIFNLLLAYILPSWDIVSLDESRVENESSKDIIERGKVYLKQTSYDAVVAAFKEANKEYKIENENLMISYIYDIADTNLKIGDIIKKVNGTNVSNFDELKNIISKYKENDKIEIEVLRDKKKVNCYSILKSKDNKLLIGVALAELKDVKTSPKVEYVFKNNESGSSRGLLCALLIYDKINDYDLSRGRVISGTGTIDENGVIGEISGVKYKILGADKKKADVFIVPSANYKEAVKVKKDNNLDIKIIKANTLNDAIKELNK